PAATRARPTGRSTGARGGSRGRTTTHRSSWWWGWAWGSCSHRRELWTALWGNDFHRRGASPGVEEKVDVGAWAEPHRRPAGSVGGRGGLGCAVCGPGRAAGQQLVVVGDRGQWPLPGQDRQILQQELGHAVRPLGGRS